MYISELKQKLTDVGSMLAAEDVANASEAKSKAVGLIAIELGGELLIDIKRIADALDGIVDHLRK